MSEAAAAPTPTPTPASAATPKMRADAWIAELDARIAARAAAITKRKKRVLILVAVTVLSMVIGGFTIGAEAVVPGFVILMIGLVVLVGFAPPYQELRRFNLPQALLVWLSNDLKPKSTVKWVIDPGIPKRKLQQRWLDGSFVLMDGTQVAMRIDLNIKTKVKRKRKSTTTIYKMRELLSVQLTLPEPPNPAGLKAVQTQLSQLGPVPLIQLETDGRRVNARFSTGMGRRFKEDFVSGRFEDSDGEEAGILQPYEVMNCINQLFTLLRHQPQAAAS